MQRGSSELFCSTAIHNFVEIDTLTLSLKLQEFSCWSWLYFTSWSLSSTANALSRSESRPRNTSRIRKLLYLRSSQLRARMSHQLPTRQILIGKRFDKEVASTNLRHQRNLTIQMKRQIHLTLSHMTRRKILSGKTKRLDPTMMRCRKRLCHLMMHMMPFDSIYTLPIMLASFVSLKSSILQFPI